GAMVGALRGSVAKTIALLLLGAVLGLPPSNSPWAIPNYISQTKNAYNLVNQILQSWLKPDPFIRFMLSRVSPWFRAGYELTIAAIQYFSADPPLPAIYFAGNESTPANTGSLDLAIPASLAAGAVLGRVDTGRVSVSGNLQASWSSTTAAGFNARSLSAAGATIRNAAGVVVGSGNVSWNGSLAIPIQATSGRTAIAGVGTLSSYGPAVT